MDASEGPREQAGDARIGASAASDADEIARAVAGDRMALERLLLAQYPRLAAQVARRFPRVLKGVVGVEDVLQETFVEAFRKIGSFEARTVDAFYHWLATIAAHRLLDAAKRLRALKRGAGRKVSLTGADAENSSIVPLLEQLAAHEHTPSRSAVSHEMVNAVQVALAGLKARYRQALRLRYIEGVPLADVAARMGLTERAVDHLCERGRQQLRAVLHRSSRYLKRP